MRSGSWRRARSFRRFGLPVTSPSRNRNRKQPSRPPPTEAPSGAGAGGGRDDAGGLRSTPGGAVEDDFGREGGPGDRLRDAVTVIGRSDLERPVEGRRGEENGPGP